MGMSTEAVNLGLSIFGSIVSIGIVYGTLNTQVKNMREEIVELKRNAERNAESIARISAVESKLDILISHFIK